MKRCGNIFDKIVSYENLIDAAYKASKGKRKRDNVISFNKNLIDGISDLRDKIMSGAYSHGQYREFSIYDGKKRIISAAPFRDRVVHHAICNIIMPIFEKTFINTSYANRIGKGTHRAVMLCKKYIRKYDYYMKFDIVKYFPSIDHETLKDVISSKIKCHKTLELINKIIDSFSIDTPFQYFPGDCLFTPSERKNGLPIGNLTSQYFANIYLTSLDHFILGSLKIRSYIRFVDDFVIFHNDKEYINYCKIKIAGFLTGIRLKIHQNKAHAYKSKNGIAFLGYRIFRTHIWIKRKNVINARRRIKMFFRGLMNGDIESVNYRSSVSAWEGHAKTADSWRIRKKIIVMFHPMFIHPSPYK